MFGKTGFLEEKTGETAVNHIKWLGLGWGDLNPITSLSVGMVHRFCKHWHDHINTVAEKRVPSLSLHW